MGVHSKNVEQISYCDSHNDLRLFIFVLRNDERSGISHPDNCDSTFGAKVS